MHTQTTPNPNTNENTSPNENFTTPPRQSRAPHNVANEEKRNADDANLVVTPLDTKIKNLKESGQNSTDRTGANAETTTLHDSPFDPDCHKPNSGIPLYNDLIPPSPTDPSIKQLTSLPQNTGIDQNKKVYQPKPYFPIELPKPAAYIELGRNEDFMMGINEADCRRKRIDANLQKNKNARKITLENARVSDPNERQIQLPCSLTREPVNIERCTSPLQSTTINRCNLAPTPSQITTKDQPPCSPIRQPNTNKMCTIPVQSSTSNRCNPASTPSQTTTNDRPPCSPVRQHINKKTCTPPLQNTTSNRCNLAPTPHKTYPMALEPISRPRKPTPPNPNFNHNIIIITNKKRNRSRSMDRNRDPKSGDASSTKKTPHTILPPSNQIIFDFFGVPKLSIQPTTQISLPPRNSNLHLNQTKQHDITPTTQPTDPRLRDKIPAKMDTTLLNKTIESHLQSHNDPIYNIRMNNTQTKPDSRDQQIAELQRQLDQTTKHCNFLTIELNRVIKNKQVQEDEELAKKMGNVKGTNTMDYENTESTRQLQHRLNALVDHPAHQIRHQMHHRTDDFLNVQDNRNGTNAPTSHNHDIPQNLAHDLSHSLPKA